MRHAPAEFRTKPFRPDRDLVRLHHGSFAVTPTPDQFLSATRPLGGTGSVLVTYSGDDLGKTCLRVTEQGNGLRVVTAEFGRIDV
jgi:hypothetical protein